MKAEELLKEGKPKEAIDALMQAVRDNPANADYRIFLFQLMTVIGQFDRALNQLNVVGDMDAKTLAIVQTYREVLQCEPLRAVVFAGTKSPLIFGDPESWIASVFEALKLDADGHHVEAQSLRSAAFEESPVSSGQIDGADFEWIADADSRIGPFLEAVINGKYYWIPFHRIRKIDLYKPEDLRDLVWLPAEFTWPNEGQTVGFIPVRYVGSELTDDPQVQLARVTQWQEMTADAYSGIGQRVFTTDQDDYSLLDIRSIEFTVDPDTEEATQDGKQEADSEEQ